MKIYHDKNTRHVVNNRGRVIVTSLQIRRYGFLWYYVSGWRNIQFQTRGDRQPVLLSNGNPMLGLNPTIIDFIGYGHMELWDGSTFNLKERLAHIYNEYLLAKSRNLEIKNIIEEQLTKL